MLAAPGFFAMLPYEIRGALPTDEDQLLGSLPSEQVNLPEDVRHPRLEQAQKSWTRRHQGSQRREYVFVLVDVEKQRSSDSMIIAQLAGATRRTSTST